MTWGYKPDKGYWVIVNDEKCSSLDEYFKLHPEDEDSFYDDMAQFASGCVEYPEDFIYA